MKLDISRLRNCLLLVALTALLNAAFPLCVPAQQPANSRGIGVEIKGADGAPVRLYEKSYALLIGVSEYAHWPQLPGVKKDLAAVRRMLEAQGFEVVLVENPNSLQLDQAFKDFIEKYDLQPDNRLLFYFAGHGYTLKLSYGDDMGYIVPADAPNPKVDLRGFRAKALDMQQLEDYARRIEAKHALFLFDSCFSGSFFGRGRAIPEAISYKVGRPVREFITSGSADETVPDQSIFRQQLIDGVEGEADTNGDGYVTGTELGEFLQDRIVTYSRNAQHPQYGKIQNPKLNKGDFVFMLPSAANPVRPAPPANVSTGAPAKGLPDAPANKVVDAAAIELSFWETIRNSTNIEDFKAYVSEYPTGRFLSLAKIRIAALTPVATPERPPAPSFSPITVAVTATALHNGWTNTGLLVRRGQHLRLKASGQVSLGGGKVSTPAGLNNLADKDKLMRNEPTGALIAVIGDDNDDFIAVGARGEFVAQRDGRLFLGVNEGNLNDNSGDYSVTVEAENDGQTSQGAAPTNTGALPPTTQPAAPVFIPFKVRVLADNTKNGWNDTGLMVRRGQRLRITATGRVALGNGIFSTPTGLPRLVDKDKLMPNEPTGALIAVIGDDNDEFIFIGASREFVAQRAGRLFLGVNEGNLNDNTGAYDVTVEAEAVGNKQ